MPTINERLGQAAAEVRKLADKANDPAHKWSAEDEANWTKANSDYDALKAAADREARAAQIEADLAQPANPGPKPGREDGRLGEHTVVTEQHRADAIQGWFRRQSGKSLKKRHIEAAKLTGINPRRRHLDLTLGMDYNQVRHQCRAAAAQKRAQSINLETAGGYLRPEGFVPQVEIALLAYCPVREYCDVMRTESGNDLPWPTTNDTTNKGSLIAENTTVSEVDETFGQTVFHAYKYTTGLVLVPAELLEDSGVNLVMILGELLGIRLGRIHADHFTFGTGSGQPTGYVTAATVGVTTASPTAIAADEIYDLKHSVDPAYRPGAMWSFHDSVLKYIKKLKDGLGRYLWQSSLAGGVPDTIDGDGLFINQSMASSVAANNITMAYGQMSKFKVRDVSQIRMLRLVERYADSDQEAFVGFQRADSNLLDAGTHPIKTMQQHS